MKDYIRKLRPVLDKENKFLFFGNHKAGLTSVNRTLLKDRVINWKSFKKNYYKEFDKYSDEEIQNMFKFTIVRNPFDRLVSAFFYLRKHNIIPKKEFIDFIKQDIAVKGPDVDPHVHFQYPSAYYEKNVFVDYIARLENIENDWKVIASSIGCPPKLPHRNRTNHKPYQQYYDKESVEIVKEIYRLDIRWFGYRFEK